MSHKTKLLAACGLDCSSCPAHIAYLTNDDDLRIATAKKWQEQFAECGQVFKPEDVNCVGCNAKNGVHIGHCGECAIRLCALNEKQIANCFVCQEFSDCQKRKDFEAQTGLDINTNFTKDQKE